MPDTEPPAAEPELEESSPVGVGQAEMRAGGTQDAVAPGALGMLLGVDERGGFCVPRELH